MRELKRELQIGRTVSLCLEPEHMIQRSVEPMALASLLVGPYSRSVASVVLVCRLTAPSMRALARVASIGSSHVFIPGVDTADDLLTALTSSRSSPKIRPTELARLPDRLQRVAAAAAAAPSDWSVKRMAAEAFMSTRTLERWFVRAGLDSPSYWLRGIRTAKIG